MKTPMTAESIQTIQTIVATDCGSTTTKAILIEKQNGEYRLIERGEAPTTVEEPVADVTQGVINAFLELEELTGKKIVAGQKLIKPRHDDREGVDLYVSTSSAGGGLQMMVAGVVKNMTAESAARAAYGGGAVVMDILATNDGRQPHETIDRIRKLRPDMLLLSGGIDGGAVDHVVKMAEIIGAASPKARLDATFQLPVIYAGNIKAREAVQKALVSKAALDITENLRPTLERENLLPARQKIQNLFLEHVMMHAPGYPNLLQLTDAPVMPTPLAVGYLIQRVAATQNIQVVGVDIGGATTDMFSVFATEVTDEKGIKKTEKVFNRSVSANLGMSYSIANVLAEAGLANIMRWVPFPIDEREVRNRIKNKMIRPTTIPSTQEDLLIEHAIAREALRLSLLQHRSLAVGLRGVQKQRTISDLLEQSAAAVSLVNMMRLDLLIGSGGVLSHAPRRTQATMMMLDAFQPEGVTRLAVDSIFMMPHLGVLASVHELAALQVFEKDCLIPLGTCLAPAGTPGKTGPALQMKITVGNVTQKYEWNAGCLAVLPLAPGNKAHVEIKPAKNLDMGAGAGASITQEILGGVVGIIIDTRGRPLVLPEKNEVRIAKLLEWSQALAKIV